MFYVYKKSDNSHYIHRCTKHWKINVQYFFNCAKDSTYKGTYNIIWTEQRHIFSTKTQQIKRLIKEKVTKLLLLPY